MILREEDSLIHETLEVFADIWRLGTESDKEIDGGRDLRRQAELTTDVIGFELDLNNLRQH